MHAPSTRRVLISPALFVLVGPALRCPTSWNCHCSGVRRSAWAEHGGLVVLVDEVGAVAAAALLEVGGGTGEDALAAVAVDAGPRAGEEREVEDPGALFVGVFEADPLVEVVGHIGSWSGGRALNRTAVACGAMAGEFDDIRGRLEAISEELADLAIERLKESIDAGGDELPVDERRLARARRAVEKAIGILREPDDATLD